MAVLAAGSVLFAGCVAPDSTEGGQRQPEALDDGVQATGTIDQSRISISNGAPDVVVGDCDPSDGLDRDVCFVVRTIDGETIAIVIENPDVLVPGERVEVVEDPCTTCDDVEGGVVVSLRVNGDERRAIGGRIDVSAADERQAGEFRFDFTGGDQLIGTFNVRPRRLGES